MPPAQSSAAAASSSIEDALLKDFWRLPVELQQRILLLACRAPPLLTTTGAAFSNSKFSLLSLDIPTTLNVALSTRQLYPFIMGLLYAHVKITTVSALRSFHYSLSSRPALGRLVKSLHIGPVDDLPRHWWPLDVKPDRHTPEYPETWLATSLDDNDLDNRPQWCDARRTWSLSDHSSEQPACHERAILRAITNAFRAIDVDLDIPHCNRGTRFDRERLGRDSWNIRVFEVQAALDIYLASMRTLEDAHGFPLPLTDHHSWQPSGAPLRCWDTHCDHYPNLAVQSFLPKEPLRDSENWSQKASTMYVTRAQLQAHLARRGSLTDRLDSPLLLARSGMLTFDGNESTRMMQSNEYRDQIYVLADGPKADTTSCHDFGDVFAIGDPGAHVFSHVGPRDSTPALDPALSSAATLGSMLALARSVLSLTPSITNLSLAGFLDRAICGTHQVVLRALRFLSLGPPAPNWAVRPYLAGPALASVEKLRICGSLLTRTGAGEVAGKGGALPRLREIHLTHIPDHSWIHTDPDDTAASTLGDGGLFVLKVIDYLSRNTQPETLEAAQGHKRKRGNKEGGAQDEAKVPTFRAGDFYIEAHLSRQAVAALKAKASSEVVRHAWTHGLPHPAASYRHLRLRLVELSDSVCEEPDESLQPPPLPQQLYDEVLDWWEERAKESGTVQGLGPR